MLWRPAHGIEIERATPRSEFRFAPSPLVGGADRPSDVDVAVTAVVTFEHNGEATFVDGGIQIIDPLPIPPGGNNSLPAIVSIPERSAFSGVTVPYPAVSWEAGFYEPGTLVTIRIHLNEVFADGTAIRELATDTFVVNITAAGPPDAEFRNISFDFTVS